MLRKQHENVFKDQIWTIYWCWILRKEVMFIRYSFDHLPLLRRNRKWVVWPLSILLVAHFSYFDIEILTLWRTILNSKLSIRKIQQPYTYQRASLQTAMLVFSRIMTSHRENTSHVYLIGFTITVTAEKRRELLLINHDITRNKSIFTDLWGFV
jgi:hypothetical protein